MSTIIYVNSFALKIDTSRLKKIYIAGTTFRDTHNIITVNTDGKSTVICSGDYISMKTVFDDIIQQIKPIWK